MYAKSPLFRIVNSDEFIWEKPIIQATHTKAANRNFQGSPNARKKETRSENQISQRFTRNGYGMDFV